VSLLGRARAGLLPKLLAELLEGQGKHGAVSAPHWAGMGFEVLTSCQLCHPPPQTARPTPPPRPSRRDILAERPGLFSLVFGAVGFPAAFTMIVLNGAELFTCERRAGRRAAARAAAPGSAAPGVAGARAQGGDEGFAWMGRSI
jgi:hypothetical protein